MASISDVAKLAGVSRSTVSLVCNNKGYVSREMREKIERAMRELNYTPSELGRNLKKQRSGIIGIIIPDMAHPFFSGFVKYAEKALYSRGYKTMICGTASREDVEAEYLNMLERHTMDGVIMGSHSLGVEKYREISRPILALDRHLSETIPVVRTDKEQTGIAAAELFLEKGCRNVVQMASSHTVKNYEHEKEDIFRKLLEEKGVLVTDIPVGYNAFTEDAYQDAARRVFELCPDADGILGVDMAIMACMKEARRRGKRVPQDIHMTAIDGTFVTRIGERQVTAIVQPVEKMAEACVDLILDMVEKNLSVPLQTVFPISVQKGETM